MLRKPIISRSESKESDSGSTFRYRCQSLLTAMIIIAGCSIASAWPAMLAPTAQVPQPAVVRVIATERDGTSMGSGSLVAVDANHGLVITNWHVVRDATGPITVVFPDGFRSGALVLRVDRDWDLAALAIQKPNVQPIRVSTETPRPGEPLTIAGYGPEGVYRAVSGRCTEYLSPASNLPAELVEVDVQARKGDSGGPIYNSRGEIAGVLFGAGGNFLTGGYTMGSYCGRVRQFLAASYVTFEQLPGSGQGTGSSAVAQQVPAGSTSPHPEEEGAGLRPLPPPPSSGLDTRVASSPATNPFTRSPAANSHAPSPQPRAEAIAASLPVTAPAVQPLQTSPIAQVSPAAVGPTSEIPSRFDQIKTVLAVIGIVFLLFHGLRLIGSAVG
jgi:hypothetical protein